MSQNTVLCVRGVLHTAIKPLAGPGVRDADAPSVAGTVTRVHGDGTFDFAPHGSGAAGAAAEWTRLRANALVRGVPMAWIVGCGAVPPAVSWRSHLSARRGGHTSSARAAAVTSARLSYSAAAVYDRRADVTSLPLCARAGTR